MVASGQHPKKQENKEWFLISSMQFKLPLLLTLAMTIASAQNCYKSDKDCPGESTPELAPEFCRGLGYSSKYAYVCLQKPCGAKQEMEAPQQWVA
ncbi:hypothetical protein DFQ26_003360 [Actinomortierella ambigua]|nr:hypothetical protein DFQ26_003360 [Actinomortierella ambigua]